jgi:hypothetical protein
VITITYEFKDQAELEAFVLQTVRGVTEPKVQIKKGRGRARPKAEQLPLNLNGGEYTVTYTIPPTAEGELLVEGPKKAEPEPVEVRLTLEDVQNAIIALNEQKGMTVVNKLLRLSGITKLREVPESEYGKLIAACKEAMI